MIKNVGRGAVLFVAEGFDGVHVSGFDGGVEAESQAYRAGDSE